MAGRWRPWCTAGGSTSSASSCGRRPGRRASAAPVERQGLPRAALGHAGLRLLGHVRRRAGGADRVRRLLRLADSPPRRHNKALDAATPSGAGIPFSFRRRGGRASTQRSAVKGQECSSVLRSRDEDGGGSRSRPRAWPPGVVPAFPERRDLGQPHRFERTQVLRGIVARYHLMPSAYPTPRRQRRWRHGLASRPAAADWGGRPSAVGPAAG